MVAVSPEMAKSDALKLEYRVKQVPASKKKIELTKEEHKMTKKLMKDLENVKKKINALVTKTESLLKEVDRFEKPKAVKKPKAKPAKAKAVKKAAPANAADIVLSIIKRSKKGVGTDALMKKTGYEKKKISNLVYKLTKQGKIKTVAKGVYVKA